MAGQTEDKKLQFGKTGEIILSPAAFSQALKTMQEVDAELKKRVEDTKKVRSSAVNSH